MRMRSAVVLSTAVAVTFGLGSTAAFAAPAAIKPGVTLKSSSKSAFVGATVTFGDTFRLPAKDKVKSWTLAYGDRTKATGTAHNVPKGAHHAYKVAGRMKAVFTVTDVHKKSWSAAVVVTVANLPVVTPPAPVAPAPTTPPPPPYVAPTGVITGHVTLGGAAVANVSVSVVSLTYAAPAVTTTNDHGDWAFPAPPPSNNGWLLAVNADIFTYSPPTILTGTNTGFPVYRELQIVAGSTSSIDLPALSSTVTGSIGRGDDPSLALAPGTYVGGFRSLGFGASLTTFGTVSGTTYSLPLAPGMTWEVDGYDDTNCLDTLGDDDTATNGVVTPPATGPSLTLLYDCSSSFAGGATPSARALAHVLAKQH